MSDSVEGSDWRGNQASPQGGVPGPQVKAGAQHLGSHSEPGGATTRQSVHVARQRFLSGRGSGDRARGQGGCRHVGHTVWGDGTGPVLAPVCGRKDADQKAKAAEIVLSFEKNVRK